MKRREWLGAAVFAIGALSPAAAQDPAWFSKLGDAPGETVFRDTINSQLATENRLTAVCKTQQQIDRNACQLMMPPDYPDLGQLQGQSKQLGLNPFPLLNPPKDSTTGAAIPTTNWQPVADALAAYVNIYKLAIRFGDPNPDSYKDRARDIAEWFRAWNDYLVAGQTDPAVPYIGWYESETRKGYFNTACAASHNFNVVNTREYTVNHADEAWDTAAAARGLLKYSEIDQAGISSVYFQRAKSILESWALLGDHASGDGNPNTPDLATDPSSYAREGMRWYKKSNEPCEIRYEKNTNLVMGEPLFRLYALSHDRTHLEAAKKVLHSQLWDIVDHQSFGYNSYMIRIDRSDPVYAAMVADDDDATHPKVEHRADGTTVCVAGNVSCWNHLGFEGYDLYVIQQVIGGPDFVPGDFPVPTMQTDINNAINQTMAIWHSSIFGDADQFWVSGIGVKGASATHVTAYNCALRFYPSDPNGDRLRDCKTALGHSPTGHTIFYSLVPDALFTQGPAR
jgi:hypothetical protein